MPVSIDAVYDIECSQWDEFLTGALWTVDDGVRVYRDPGELADALMALAGLEVWAHAGGKYDALWLLDVLDRRGDLARSRARVYMSGSSATSVRFTDGPWLRDSARLLPMTLARAASIVGREKGDPGLTCICGRACGGYCSLSRDMSRAEWSSVEEYLVSDIEILRDVLMRVGEYAGNEGIDLRGTIGGTAWATAQRWCGIEKQEWDSRAYKITREGYHGGRCEVGKTRAAHVWNYDRKSAYPAALCKPLPTGEMRILDARTARLAWDRGKPGVYHARVEVPECHSPPLPVKWHGRLTFPHGTVEGAWPRDELKHALECGAKIATFYDGVAWAREESALEPFARRCFELRDREPGGGLNTWLKYLNNSLTGKTGQSPDSREVAIGDFADDEKYEQVGASACVWSRAVWRIPDCAAAHWAATLTGDARVELHRQILHAGDEWCYSDTDSVKSARPLDRRLGDGIGEWAFEGEWENFRCPAPKVYAGDGVNGAKGARHAKGIPDGEDPLVWERYARGDAVSTDRGVKGLLTAARGSKLFERRRLTRQMKPATKWVGARLRDGDGTLAPSVRDLSDL